MKYKTSFLILMLSAFGYFVMAQNKVERFCVVTVQLRNIAFAKYGYRIEDVKIDSSAMLEKEDSATTSNDAVALKNRNSTSVIFNYMAQRGWAFAGSTQLGTYLVQYQFKKEE